MNIQEHPGEEPEDSVPVSEASPPRLPDPEPDADITEQ